jgi:outer membrane immunogenic protein
MRKLLLASVAFTALAMGTALAADMPPLRTPTSMPYFNWSGIYLGINGGYGWGRSNWTGAATDITTGDFDIKGSTAVNCTPLCETANTWLGTVRGRLGVGLDRFLPYLTGGIAFGRVTTTVIGAGNASNTNLGWTAGGGLEYAFAGRWSAKVEYLYVDLDNSTCDAACSGATPFDVDFRSHLVRAGLNYKF